MPNRKSGSLASAALLLGVLVLVVGAVLTLLVGFLNEGFKSSGGLRIGTTEAGKDSWDVFVAESKARGINLVTVNFSSYQQPNDALAQKQVNLNLFQHLRFLAEYNVSHNANLTPVASTYITPLGLYSKKHKTLAEIPRGGQVAIPNDPSNQGRALFVLRSAGLVTIVGEHLSPTANDVDQDASKIRVIAVDPAQTPRTLDSVDGAVVNNSYLSDAGIDPTTALAKDDPADPGAQQYINVIVVAPEDQNDPVYQKLGEVYHSQPVQDAYTKESKGTQVLVTKTPRELQQILANIEAKIRAGA